VATAESLPAYGYVAWLNSFFGPVVFEGKQLEETKAFGRVRDKLVGVVRIRQRGGSSNVLHLNAIREMTSRYLTYKEALPSPEFTLWDRQRLREAQREIDEQLVEIFGRDDEVQSSTAVAAH
jgi:hypothetical protein